MSSYSLAIATEWTRDDLYKDGSKSVIDGDCFTAIAQLFAFKEFNKSLLDEHKDTKKTIDATIQKCRSKILAKTKVEYRFLPTENDCNYGAASVSSLGLGKMPKIKYRIVRKKGNPKGMEIPDFDIMFDLETSRGKVSYPLVPSFYNNGEFKPYGSGIHNLGINAASEPEVRFSSDILKQYMESNNPRVESYIIDPSSFNEQIQNLEGSGVELLQRPNPAFR
jgi:hypothetical protein